MTKILLTNLLLVTINFIVTYSVVDGSPPIVKIGNGKLIGTTYTLPNGRVVYAFYGIPYAAPPIGYLRFEPPIPAKSWRGFRNASFHRSACLQFKPNVLKIPRDYNEDCLYLNVFIPKLPTKERNFDLMNVMVNIHGGGFYAGIGTDAKPDYILQSDDIVFASFNYRVGILGFFSSGDLLVPGNNGLKDQVFALQWVRENIHHFGGDPTKVTLYGNSAGSACVQFHLISPLSNGFYQNAISTSGSALNPWALPPMTMKNSFKVASLLNCPTHNTKQMLRCLKVKSIENIFNVSQSLRDNEYSILFGPVIEPKHRLAFLSRHPLRQMKNKEVKRIPLLIGTTENEGSFVGINSGLATDDLKLKYLNDNWNEMAPELFLFDYIYPKSEQQYISSIIRQYYFNKSEVTNETANQLLRSLGDRWFHNGITESIKLFAETVGKNVYCYKFRYRGNESFCRDKQAMKKFGTCHADDIFYLLNIQKRKLNHDKSAANIIKFMVSNVIAFMKNSNPITELVNWKPVARNGTSVNCLNIHSSTFQEIEDIANTQSIEFWNNILPEGNRLEFLVT